MGIELKHGDMTGVNYIASGHYSTLRNAFVDARWHQKGLLFYQTELKSFSLIQTTQ